MKKIVSFIFLSLTLYSCDEIVLEDDISGETVHLIAPVDGAQFSSTGITFTWEAIENGTQYQIQIARPDFDNPLQIVADNTVDTTSFTTQLNIGTYEWRVRAVNSGYKTAWSKRSIIVANNEDFQSNSVTLTLPADNIITNTASQNLVWQPVIGATGYHLQIINTENSTIEFEQDVTSTSYTYNFTEGNHAWKIRATNGTQNTLYSSRSILTDTTVPNTPVLTLPANQSTTSDNDVTFQWNRTPVNGSTEKDSLYIYSNAQLNILKYKNEQTSPYSTSTLEDGTYYWFVKSFDQAGNAGAQSSVFSFTLN